MKKAVVFLLGIVICLSLGFLAQAAPLSVQSVKTKLIVEQNAPSLEVQSKVKLSLQRVSEKLLLGQKVELVEVNQSYLEDTVKEVFTKVLLGYEVTGVRLIPGRTSQVVLSVRPAGEKVESVILEVEVSDLSPEIKALLTEQAEKLEKKIGTFLLGLPIETGSWSESALEPLLEGLIAGKMPGFQTKVDFIWGRTTKIVLSLKPETPVVKQVRVKIKSTSIPRLFLEEWRRKLERKGELITGLPVAFLDKYLPEIEEKTEEELANNALLQKMALKVQPEFYIGEITEVNITVFSERYNVGLEGNLTVGSDAPANSEFKAHLGYYPDSKQELYIEPVFYPNPIELQVKIGYDYSLDRYSSLGYFYNLSKNDNYLRYQYNFAKGRLKAEYNLNASDWLISYRYPLQEYLFLEAFTDFKGKNWLAVTADL